MILENQNIEETCFCNTRAGDRQAGRRFLFFAEVRFLFYPEESQGANSLYYFISKTCFA